MFPPKPVYKTLKPRGRGKPATHPVDKLRTRLWFHVITLRSGLPSGYAVEKFLDGDFLKKDDAGIFRPRKWPKYQKGIKVPSDRLGSRNAVDQAESYFPGTAQWFRSPLWQILRGEKCDRYFVEKGLRQLPPDIKKVFFEEESHGQSLLSAQKPLGSESNAELLAIGGFDTLVAAVLLVVLSEDIASPTLRELQGNRMNAIVFAPRKYYFTINRLI